MQKNYQADIVGFSDVLHREDYKAWKEIKADWPTVFPELEVKVEVNVNTSSLGTMTNLKLKE
nr:Ger(x)C family spore germination C-terminal domain-containing protein [Lysinibacillus parviboronicapiens]